MQKAIKGHKLATPTLTQEFSCICCLADNHYLHTEVRNIGPLG